MRNCFKVLVLAQYYPPDMGGASTRVSNVVKGLTGKGCNVIVVAAFPHYPHGQVPQRYRGKALVREKVNGAEVWRVWIPALAHNTIVNRILLHLCFIVSSLFALPFVGKADIIWVANPNLFGFYAALMYSIVKRIPIVRNVDDLWPEVFYELGYVKSNLVRKILDFFGWLSYVVPTSITPFSMGYKRSITAKYGISSEKVHVIEVGVDQVAPFSVNRITVSRFVVMYSGVLGLGYDFDVVLKAARFLDKTDDIIFVIRGIGEMTSKLRASISDLGLRNVLLDARFLSKEELNAMLRSADTFLLPIAPASFIEKGLPTKVFEYQAHGKPIVCISDGEPARYVLATKSGLIVSPKDADGLAEAVVRLYENRRLGTELGLNGWRYVSENLTAEKIGERLFRVLSSALELNMWS